MTIFEIWRKGSFVLAEQTPSTISAIAKRNKQSIEIGRLERLPFLLQCRFALSRGHSYPS
ncbi:hypothetical protein CN311_21480 [Mesorhizobium sanjuanii]|uniref:Uncharacterized protein n=1 Tax=Mesorhizobium sanjuanii TaxID=2037900 RepID=A0A2A6FBI0_9HYPH|nr:hypothetical protein CN311_21480 [Mesorhizobium sanjuanii]